MEKPNLRPYLDKTPTVVKRLSVLVMAAVLGSLAHWIFTPGRHSAQVYIPPPPPAQAAQPVYTQPLASPPVQAALPPAAPVEASPSAAPVVREEKKKSHAKARLPYPDSLAEIIDPSDWPRVKAALVIASKYSDGDEMTRWHNTDNDHRGGVIQSGGEDPQGCRQYRVTSGVGEESPHIAHVEICKGGHLE